MREYKLDFRTSKKKDKNNEYHTWTSKTYYLSFYENRVRKFIDTGETEREKAEEVAERLKNELEGGTVYLVIKKNNWLSAKESPPYLRYMAKVTDYHYLFAESLRNVRYLTIILEQFKDDIGNKIFATLSPDDVDEFLNRLASYREYIDAKGNKRAVTNTFRNGAINAFSTIYNYYLGTGEIKVRCNPFFKKHRFPKNRNPKKKFIFTPEIINLCFEREVLENIVPVTEIETSSGKKKLTKEKWDKLIHSVYIDYFYFVALTGLRGSEASAIRVEQFENRSDFYVLIVDRAFKSGVRKGDEYDFSVQFVGTPKNGKTRRIVLCDKASRIARMYAKGKSTSDLLFKRDDEDPEFSSASLQQNRARVFRIFINELNSQFGFTEDSNSLTLHGFRTSLNTNLLEKTPLRESLIAYYNGWESDSLQKTQQRHYTRFSTSDLRSVANEINKLYFGLEMVWQPVADRASSLSFQEKRLQILGKLYGIDLWRSETKSALNFLEHDIETILNGGYTRAGFAHFIRPSEILVDTLSLVIKLGSMHIDFLSGDDLRELTERDEGFKTALDKRYSGKRRILELQKEYEEKFGKNNSQ